MMLLRIVGPYRRLCRGINSCQHLTSHTGADQIEGQDGFTVFDRINLGIYLRCRPQAEQLSISLEKM